jgi:ribosomal protein L21E
MHVNVKASDIIGKSIIVTCPNSRWDGHVGYVVGCFTDAFLGFELLYEVKVHAEVKKELYQLEEDLLMGGKVDLAIDEMEFCNANF